MVIENQKGWVKGGNVTGAKNLATCDTKIYSATGLEGGTELALPALRS